MSTWQRDAKQAMTRSPRYFLWWYTVKSIGLAAAVALVAFFMGREAGRKDRTG